MHHTDINFLLNKIENLLNEILKTENLKLVLRRKFLDATRHHYDLPLS